MVLCRSWMQCRELSHRRLESETVAKIYPKFQSIIFRYFWMFSIDQGPRRFSFAQNQVKTIKPEATSLRSAGLSKPQWVDFLLTSEWRPSWSFCIHVEAASQTLFGHFSDALKAFTPFTRFERLCHHSGFVEIVHSGAWQGLSLGCQQPRFANRCWGRRTSQGNTCESM